MSDDGEVRSTPEVEGRALDNGRPKNPPPQRIAHTWRESDKFIPRKVVRPIQRIMDAEISGAAFMFIAAVLALIWANSPWGKYYVALWEQQLTLNFGSFHILDMSLHAVINDALMALFFLVVALEIKREWIFGELRDRRAAALPIIAAFGGMAVPALIYTAFNAGGGYSHGWGIPMATDIAFAVAVVALVGPRVPTSARLFLLTLAIVDDLGAILVIAIFYAGGLAFGWLAGAIAMCVLAWLAARANIRALPVFVVLGVLCWYMLHESGVHSTIAGVAFGFLTPAWSYLNPKEYAPVATQLVKEVDQRFEDGVLTHDEHADTNVTLKEIVRLSNETQAPLERIVFKLANTSAFFVVPLFAFSNAGVFIPRVSPTEWLVNPVVLGIGLGLIVGKTIGIFGAAWLAAKIGIAKIPDSVTKLHLLGVSMCGGVGFTVAMFVSNLAFPGDDIGDLSKLSILLASAIAGTAGYLILRLGAPASTTEGEGGEAEPEIHHPQLGAMAPDLIPAGAKPPRVKPAGPDANG